MRDFGYYWVKYEGEWEVARFAPWRGMDGNIKSANWERIGELFEEYDDSDFGEIHEVVIPFPATLGAAPAF